VLSSKVGSFGYLLNFFVTNFFDNLNLIKDIKMPTFFLHGKRDNVIPFDHSTELINSKKNGESHLVDPPAMTHNDYINWEINLGQAGADFMRKCKVAENSPKVDAQQLLDSKTNKAAIQDVLGSSVSRHI